MCGGMCVGSDGMAKRGVNCILDPVGLTNVAGVLVVDAIGGLAGGLGLLRGFAVASPFKHHALGMDC